VDFKETKRTVSIETVLAHYNVQLRRVNSQALRGSCPLPMHSAKGEQSFSVNVTKNIWSCMSTSCVKARQGKKGGNVLDFTALMEGSSIRDAALKLTNWFGVTSGAEQTTASNKKEIVLPEASAQGVTEQKIEGEVTNTNTVEGGNKPLGFALKGIDHSHPYVTARGITPELAAYFGVGYFSGKGSMHNRCVIEIRNRGGELVAYAGRSIDNSEPKYKFPSGFRKIELWNLYRVLALNPVPKRVILCEGFFDAIRVHTAGYPHVVSLMGSSMSDEQEHLLASHFKGIILMLDGDEAGKRAKDEIALRLARLAFVRIAAVPDDKQPDELSHEELQRLLGAL
jgi:DNA primase